MPLPLPHLLLPGMMMTRMRLRTRTLRGLSRLLPRVLFVKVLITLAHLALREITMVVRVVMALVLTLKMMTLYIYQLLKSLLRIPIVLQSNLCS